MQDPKYWSTVKVMVEKVVTKIQGETGTSFEDKGELVQECLVNAFVNLDKYEGRDGCEKFSFLYTLCKNHLINYHIFHTRKRRDYRVTITSGLNPENRAGVFTFGDNLSGLSDTEDYNDPLEVLIAEEMLELLEDAYKVDKYTKKFVDKTFKSEAKFISTTTKMATLALSPIMDYHNTPRRC